jgi:hypothetical protein
MVAAHSAEPGLINQVEAFDVLGAAVDKVANRNQQILCWVEPDSVQLGSSAACSSHADRQLPRYCASQRR